MRSACRQDQPSSQDDREQKVSHQTPSLIHDASISDTLSIGDPARARAADFQAVLAGMPTGKPWNSGSRSASTALSAFAERKLRRRQLTDDGNVEISGRDLR
jgi:hypothetical protein